MSSNESDRPAEESVPEELAALMREMQRRIERSRCRRTCTLCQFQCGRIGGAHTCLVPNFGEMQMCAHYIANCLSIRVP